MFVTGPDVIRTVTHEEVTKDELGGAMTHNSRSASPTSPSTTTARASSSSASCCPTSPRTTWRRPARPRDERPRSTARSRTRHPRPRRADEALRHEATSIQRGRRRRPLLRGPRALRAEHRRRLRALRRPQLRRRREPARAPRGLPRHRRLGEGRALRALLRRLQHPPRDVRGRAGLPPRHRPGVRRDHPPRREAPLRVRRGHGAEGHRHHSQGLRRRVLRHGVASTSAPTSTTPGRLPRSPSWARRAR